jgi:hypothetical protein
MSITMDDPHRSQSTIATAKIIEYQQNAFSFRDLAVE